MASHIVDLKVASAEVDYLSLPILSIGSSVLFACLSPEAADVLEHETIRRKNEQQFEASPCCEWTE